MRHFHIFEFKEDYVDNPSLGHAVEQGHPNPPAHPYVFLPHFRAPPIDHPMNVRDKADIVVAVGPASGYK